MSLNRGSSYTCIQISPLVCRWIPDCDLILIPGGCAGCDFHCAFLPDEDNEPPATRFPRVSRALRPGGPQPQPTRRTQ
jgi:hypothetical protein